MFPMPRGGSRNICTVCIAVSLFPYDRLTKKKVCLVFFFCPKKRYVGNEELRKRIGNGVTYLAFKPKNTIKYILAKFLCKTDH